jgi:hypothetical protein
MSLGLLGTLEMSKRALDTNRQGIELTGHNLSNVSNPAYARQRLKIQTSDTLPSPIGPTGTGSRVVQIEQLRNQLLDSQVVSESSVTGFLEAKQKALQFWTTDRSPSQHSRRNGRRYRRRRSIRTRRGTFRFLQFFAGAHNESDLDGRSPGYCAQGAESHGQI